MAFATSWRAVPETSPAPRLAVFTYDRAGLAHVQRCVRLLRAVAERAPDSALLLVTGAPAWPLLGDLPVNADCVKIPACADGGHEDGRAPRLPLPPTETTRLRARLIEEAVLGFTPDVLLVDNAPLGARRELLPVLEAVPWLGTRRVLGLADLPDPPEVVRADWTRQQVYEVLESGYDHILVYGVRAVFDVVDAYGFPESVAAKTRYCGYVSERGTGGDALDLDGVARVAGHLLELAAQRPEVAHVDR